MKSNVAYKIDKYSVFKESKDRKHLLAFNFRNGALAKLEKTEDSKISTIISKGWTEDLIFISENLDFVANYMVPAHVNETELVRLKFRQQQEAENELNLTILTTLACNFSCYYCYEKREASRLDELVENKIIELIKKRLGKLEKVALCWYGGEPLLVRKSIERVNQIVSNICKQNAILFGSKIVTNGYLFNSDIADSLHASGVQEIQVSLDGPKHIHDKIRHQNGKPTFDIILDNIFGARHRFNIIIRINVSEENKGNIPELLNQLVEKGLQRYTTIYFANLHSNGVGCSDMSEPQLDGLIKTSDFLKKSLEYKQLALDSGFRVRTPLSTTTLCSAVIKGGFVIEPNGDAKKCYLDVSNT